MVWPKGIARSVGYAPPHESQGAAQPCCPSCGRATLRSHAELLSLSVAHIDCDAFYASVEKRDNPALRDKPVIVGHPGGRGVVTTACYVARRYGPRSAMPMFKALELCPDAVVIRPDMAKYRAVSLGIRTLMLELTDAIEPLSLDEAYLDLAMGSRRDPSTPPAVLLARLALVVRRDIGISISIGLSANKFLSKLASDMDKPRGFAVIGAAEAAEILAPLPVTRIHGIGPATRQRLARDGISVIGQLQQMSDVELQQRFGRFGERLSGYVRGHDLRPVVASRETKSVSAETTFERDLSDAGALLDAVAPLCRRVGERLARSGLAGRAVVLKLKSSSFQTTTRTLRLAAPTQRSDLILVAAEKLLAREVDHRRYRLIGIGICDLAPASAADPPDLFTRVSTENDE